MSILDHIRSFRVHIQRISAECYCHGHKNQSVNLREIVCLCECDYGNWNWRECDRHMKPCQECSFIRKKNFRFYLCRCLPYFPVADLLITFGLEQAVEPRWNRWPNFEQVSFQCSWSRVFNSGDIIVVTLTFLGGWLRNEIEALRIGHYCSKSITKSFKHFSLSKKSNFLRDWIQNVETWSKDSSNIPNTNPVWRDLGSWFLVFGLGAFTLGYVRPLSWSNDLRGFRSMFPIGLTIRTLWLFNCITQNYKNALSTFQAISFEHYVVPK